MNEDAHARFRELEPARLGLILNRWKEPHRRWHGLHHLGALLRSIEADPDLSESDREMLGYVALFHDAVYAPLRQDNEEESARLAMDYLPNYSRRDEVVETILATKTHQAENLLARKFNAWDCAILREKDWQKLLDYEKGIAFEYREVEPETYRRERGRFLKKAACDFDNPLLEQLANRVAHG